MQPCEKVDICKWASEKCKEPLAYNPETDRSIPARRWIDCHGWKDTLGLKFNEFIGGYHLEKCPVCGCDLIEYLKRKVMGSEVKRRCENE